MVLRLNIAMIRLLWAALLSAAIVFAPVAAAAPHIEEQTNAHCELCVNHETGVDVDHGDPDGSHHQEHHAHGCGTCHSHAQTVGYGTQVYLSHSGLKFPYQTEGPPSAAISGLFRPPRV